MEDTPFENIEKKAKIQLIKKEIRRHLTGLLKAINKLFFLIE